MKASELSELKYKFESDLDDLIDESMYITQCLKEIRYELVSEVFPLLSPNTVKTHVLIKDMAKRMNSLINLDIRINNEEYRAKSRR